MTGPRSYLDSVIHFAYVLLRNLEKYSKTKAFMYVRKRKANQKKRKQAEDGAVQPSMPEEYAAEEEGDAEPDRDTPSYAEHQFTFEAFEKVLDTFGGTKVRLTLTLALRTRSGGKYFGHLSSQVPRLR